MKTLEQARNETREAVMAGKSKVKCPCCDQHVKIYNRPISSQMARWLIGLVRAHRKKGDWVHVKEIGAELGLGSSAHPGDFAKLRYWGLIMERPNDDSAKRTSGYWMPTIKGENFVFGKIAIPSHAKIYDQKLLRLSGKEHAIGDALRKKFNYTELMAGLL